MTKNQKAVLGKWAKALRSGKYAQGRGTLRNGDNFCCLGVLCDIVAPNAWDGDGCHRGEAGLPSTSVLRTAGVTDERDFAALNDTARATFAEIADVVDWMRWSA